MVVAPAAKLEPRPMTSPAVQNRGNELQTRSAGRVRISSARRWDCMQKARWRCMTALGRSVEPEVYRIMAWSVGTTDSRSAETTAPGT